MLSARTNAMRKSIADMFGDSCEQLCEPTTASTPRTTTSSTISLDETTPIIGSNHDEAKKIETSASNTNHGNTHQQP